MKLTKTKMCKFEIRGLCSKGTQCLYAHSAEELKPLPDFRCTKICSVMVQTGSCNNSGCTFAHSRDELRTKTKICRFFIETGSCKLESQCHFAHLPREAQDSTATPPSEDQEQSEALPLAPGSSAASSSGTAPSTSPEYFAPTAGLDGGLAMVDEAPRPFMYSPAYVAAPAALNPWESIALPSAAAGGEDDESGASPPPACPSEDSSESCHEWEDILMELDALRLDWQASDELLSTQAARCPPASPADQQGGVVKVITRLSGFGDGPSHSPGTPAKVESALKPLRLTKASQSTLCSQADIRPWVV